MKSNVCINPHTFGNKTSKYTSFPTNVDDLGTDNPDYIEIKKDYHTAANGQLKLFAMTLEFLTYATIPQNKYLVVYPGSAPGDNIVPMLKLFPNVNWILVDPRKFHKELYNSANISLIEESFYEDRHRDTAREISQKEKRELLLISDIRNMEDTSFEKRENNIAQDMRLQEKWFMELMPEHAQLKFRLPRTFETFEYLDGEARLQMFAPHTSAETRLIVSRSNIGRKIYNVKDYDNAMHKFNQVIRPTTFRKTSKKDYLDGCYDCTAFFILVNLYNEIYNKDIDPEYMLHFVPEAWKKFKFKVDRIRNKACKHKNGPK